MVSILAKVDTVHEVYRVYRVWGLPVRVLGLKDRFRDPDTVSLHKCGRKGDCTSAACLASMRRCRRPRRRRPSSNHRTMRSLAAHADSDMFILVRCPWEHLENYSLRLTWKPTPHETFQGQGLFKEGGCKGGSLCHGKMTSRQSLVNLPTPRLGPVITPYIQKSKLPKCQTPQSAKSQNFSYPYMAPR